MSREARTGLRIGVDLDNTLVCYEPVFQRLASARALLPPGLVTTKEALRRHLCRTATEEVWTAIQGEAYGARMAAALPFPGAREFLHVCNRAGADIFVVSHRTRVPIAGPSHDLHQAARQWLLCTGILEALGTDGEHVFLETTREAKLQRISELHLDYFVDDLSDILLDASFPKDTVGVHFDPGHTTDGHARLLHAGSWRQIQLLILEPA
jgi:hypothetical protein